MPLPSKMARYPLNPNDNVIFLDITIKGELGMRMLTMVLDTGATLMTIPKEAARAIGCDPTKARRRVEIITASGTEYVPILTVGEVDFLGFKLKDVDVACLNLPPQSAANGLLGLNLLKHFRNVLDFPAKFLEIVQPV